MFHQLEALILSYADLMPLPLFAALSSFAEEIIAPIPSGPVMLVTGTLAQVQGYTLPLLFALACVAALGKLAGSLVVYVIADKAEDVFATRFARFIGISHAELEKLGSRLGNGWRDYALLTLLRTLPFVPSAVISFGAGVLKVRLRLFIIATLIGSILRDFIFLYMGYLGLAAAETLIARFSTVESFLQAGIVAGVVIAVGIYATLQWRRRR
ncbi:MAG TPA: VTT domain-containing protein [Candidatus Paceibacterota bacterium]